MAWRFTESFVVPQRIDETSTTENVPTGTIVRAQNDDGHSGEFIYLLGVVSTVVGSWVTYDRGSGLTALLAADAVGPVGIAMSANVASQYGWYQISGRAIGQAWTTLALATGVKLYATATAGLVDDAVVSGDLIYNARVGVAKTTAVGTVAVDIARPWVTDVQPTV